MSASAALKHDSAVLRQELAACAAWTRYPVDDAFFSPPLSTAPILVISGGMDHVTAPEWAAGFCAAVPSCRLVTIPALGHVPYDLDAWTNGGCFDALTVSFYRDPAAFDAECVRSMRPPPFN